LEAEVGIEPAYTALQATGGFLQIKRLAQFHFRHFVDFDHFMPLFWFVFIERGEIDFLPLS
jgi:hypothetical protein